MSKSKILTISIIGFALALVLLNLPSKKEVVADNTFISEEVIEEPTTFEIEELDAILVEVIEEIAPVVTPIDVATPLTSISDDQDLPEDVDRMNQLFQPYPPILPIMETVSYSGRVDWLTGRAAYLGDYASHYQTSKHFISRSLHGMGNYLSDIVSKGDRFNVFNKEKEIEFHLVLDLSRLKLWLYYYDKSDDAHLLLKSYPVCAGRLDNRRLSGSLTPLGTFAIGNDIVVNEPGVMGHFKNESRELISVFGVRWIPIGREIANCTGSSKGLGLQGVPWKRRPETNELYEYRECIGQYESGGCLRLLTEHIEELYAVIVSKPAFIHIVCDYSEAKLPGKKLVFN